MRVVVAAVLIAAFLLVPVWIPGGPDDLGVPSLPHRMTPPATSAVPPDTGTLPGCANCIITNISVGSGAGTPAYDPSDGDLYVPNFQSSNVSVISTQSNSLVATVSAGTYPSSATYDPFNGDIYVGNLGSGNLSVISGITNRLVATITVGIPADNSGLYPAIDPADGNLFVAVNPSGSSHVVVISGSTNSIITNVSVGADESGATFDPATGDVFVPNGGSNNVSVISAATDHLIATVPAGSLPLEATFDPGNGDLYVPNNDSANVTVISGSTDRVVANISVGSMGPGILSYDPSSGHLYVPFRAKRCVPDMPVISDSTETIVDSLQVRCDAPAPLADPANGDLYLPNGTELSVIDGLSNRQVTNISVEVGPPTYDPQNGDLYAPAAGHVVVISGGSSSASSWTNITGTVEPPASSWGDPLLVYDAADGYDLLYDNGSRYGMTASWALNHGVWSNLDVSTPLVDQMVYDAADGYVLALTHTSRGTAWPTSEFLGGAWSVLTTTGAPPVCPSPEMAYDPADQYVVLVEECDNGNPWTYATFTWSYHAGTWTNLTGLGPRPTWADGGEGLAYDAGDGYVVGFGGWNYTSDWRTCDAAGCNETWTFRGGVWTNRTNTVVGAPSDRWGVDLAYDPATGYVLMFGGHGVNLNAPHPLNYTNNETWAYAGGVWTNLTQVYGPHQRLFYSSTMAFDPSIDGVVMFGGDYWFDPYAGPIFPVNNTWCWGNCSAFTGPGLGSVAASPAMDTLPVGGHASFAATPICRGGACPAETTFAWSLANGLGTLNTSMGASVQFTAGSAAGTDTLFVNATLNGRTVQGPPVPISISALPVPTLNSVTVAPANSTLSIGQTETLTATATCHLNGEQATCPAGLVYTWVGISGFSTLNATGGSTVTVTGSCAPGPCPAGGGEVGSVFEATATLNAVSRSANATVEVVGATPPSPSGFLGSEGSTVLVGGVIAAAMGAAAFAWEKRRLRRQEGAASDTKTEPSDPKPARDG